MDRSQNSRTERAVQSLIQLIQTFADTKIIKSEVERIPKVALETFHDENDLDVLHHAIIANNTEAVTLLFVKGYFLPPHEYRSVSYIHLAAKLGHRTILGLLLQDRPEDNKAMAFKYQSASQRQYAKPADGDERTEVTPLDVAGKAGHLPCVKLILDHFLGRHHSRGRFSGKEAHINMACKLDSPFALRLLLSQSPTEEDLKSAVGAALKLARPECLDILLRLHPDLSALFKGMNLYHVLYSYSLSFDKKWVESLPAVTAVLIQHGHNVHSTIPYRTYPLYSLLCLCIKCYDMPDKVPYIIACLVVLLNAGANPNFDEVQFEMEHEDLNLMPAFGRLAYSSGLNCLYANVCSLNLELDQETKKSLDVMVQQCTELLLRHGANLQKTGRINEDGSLVGTAFHSFCDMSIRHGLDNKTLSMLLKHGLDPDIECDALYPLSLIFEDFIFTKDSKLSSTKDLNTFLNIVDLMSHSAVKDILDITSSYKVDEEDKVHLKIKTNIVRYISQVLENWSLKKQCKNLILKLCRRKMVRVLKLPLPMKLKTEILEFDVEVMN